MLHLFRKKAKGFTLIELLIVVAIIGILAAIAIPNLLSAQRKAKISKALADTKQMVTQAQLYNNDFNVYPTLTTLFTLAYISRTYDPFGATPTTQDYGFEATAAHTWALSVGPNSAAPGTAIAAWPAALGSGVSGTGCQGVVGWSNSYGNVQPSGC